MGDNASKIPPAVTFTREDVTSANSDQEVVKVIEVDLAVLEHCVALRLKHSDIKWVILKIVDGQVITVDKLLKCIDFDKDSQEDEHQFVALKDLLQAEVPRYVIYKFRMSNDDSGKEMLAFIYWHGGDCDKTDLALYDSSKHLVMQELGEEIAEFSVSDEDELLYDNFIDVLVKRK